MTVNAVAKTESTALTVAGGRNPYSEFANEVAPKNIYGTLLKFSKGDWIAGESAVLVPLGTRLAAVMDKMTRGYIRWENMRPTEQIMVEVGTGQKPPRRGELGDTDKDLWEVDDRGQPKDPWQQTIYLPLIDDKGNVYTFSTSSKGGLNAIGRLAETYGAYIGLNAPTQYPLVKLSVDAYTHPNKNFGRIKVPLLDVIGYVDKKKVSGVLAAPVVEDENLNDEDPGAGMNDEIPF